MPGWLVREYHDDDLEAVVHLWDETASLGQLSVFSVGECLAAGFTESPVMPLDDTIAVQRIMAEVLTQI